MNRKKEKFDFLQSKELAIANEEITKLRNEFNKYIDVLNQKMDFIHKAISPPNKDEFGFTIDGYGIYFTKLGHKYYQAKENCQTLTINVSYRKAGSREPQILESIDYKINIGVNGIIGWSEVKSLPENLPPYYFKMFDLIRQKNYELKEPIHSSEELLEIHCSRFMKETFERIIV